MAEKTAKINRKNSNPNGIHYLIEFFGCEAEQIDSVDFWKKILPEAVKGTTMGVLHSYFHKFNPKGVTGFLLLSSSHISVHTWPENGYVACDIFTCSSKKETDLVLARLTEGVIHDHANIEKVNRGYQFLNLPIFCNGDMMKIEINKVLHEVQSDFQKIVIADTKEYGKCLIIDDVMQTAETDHEIYDSEMLRQMKKTDKNILILGGGDGYVAQIALRNNPKLNIDIIDLDIEVVKSAQKFLNQVVFDDKKVNLSIGDALHFLKVGDKLYDGIACDLTDTPIGTKKEAIEFKKFFEKILALSKNRLRNGGWVSVQSGASCTAEGFIDEAAIIEKILQVNFTDITRSDVFIPSYGESCAFLFGKKA
ncbi:MAG: adenosylmethionine decarboxylase [Parcubacteria group bacterium]|jgi:spermidine synthase